MATIDWYFDFISPFAYLQSELLLAPSSAPARAGARSPAGLPVGITRFPPKTRIRYRPVLFAGLLAAHGHKGPAEIPGKREFTYRFAYWQAGQLGIPFKMPHEHPFNPLPLLRLAIACDCVPEAVHRIFRFVWRDGRLPDLPIEWAELVHDLRLPDAERRIADPDVKDALRRNTDEAVARGVFGVPTIAVGNEIFWGADATAMAAEYLAAGNRFADPEYARLSSLPVGAIRSLATPSGRRAAKKGA